MHLVKLIQLVFMFNHPVVFHLACFQGFARSVSLSSFSLMLLMACQRSLKIYLFEVLSMHHGSLCLISSKCDVVDYPKSIQPQLQQ